MKNGIYILISVYDKNKVPDHYETIMINDLARKATSKELFNLLFRYRVVTLICSSIEMLPMPFMVAGVCRLMTLGHCRWIDDKRTLNIHAYTLIGMAIDYVKDILIRSRYVKAISTEIDNLTRTPSSKLRVDDIKCAYVRTDEPCHLSAGGSVGHIAGVINHIGEISKNAPLFISTEKVPTVREDIEYHEIRHSIPYRNIRFINQIAYNQICYEDLCEILDNREINLLYHRYSLGSYAVAKYALLHNIPYIIEYNGSELWIIKNWSGDSMSSRRPYIDILSKSEYLLLSKANLITCVSKPLKDQLIELGIPNNKILVNPNGVDVEKYSPDIDGNCIRKKYGISKSDIVIGFIGTFGAWHGAEILAKVYVDLLKEYDNIHLFMIGDGMKMAEVKEVLSHISSGKYTLTGMIPQEQGPKYLAACDILVSPTVPNPDGTPFFGSPTKTFEYMAMGKAIVVSDMDQMGELFRNGVTALMFVPGDNEDLYMQLSKLIVDDSLRERLGENAREDAVYKYTWKKHTEKIIGKYMDIQ